MKSHYITFFLCAFLITACEKKNENLNTEVSKTKDTESPITSKKIATFKYTDYALSSEADVVIKNWAKYVELNTVINNLKQADLSFFKEDTAYINTFLTDFNTSIPKVLDTKSITSRLIVLETTMLKLHDDLTLSNIKPESQLASIKNLLEAFSNFNYRINTKIESDFFNLIKAD